MDRDTSLHVSTECNQQFLNMQKNKMWRFVSYSLLIEEHRDTVKVSNLGHRDLSIKDVQDIIPKDQARWIVFDYDYE